MERSVGRKSRREAEKEDDSPMPSSSSSSYEEGEESGTSEGSEEESPATVKKKKKRARVARPPPAEAKVDRTTLMFYSLSAAAPPGRGAKERLSAGETPASYPVLEKHPHWRRILSAFYKTDAPIKVRDLQFATQEHAYHALTKFAETAPDYARLFAVDSGSVFARDPGLAKMAGGRTGKVRVDKKVVYTRPAGVRANLGPRPEVVYEIMLAKYTQDPLARSILLGTRDAVLTHWTRGKPQVEERELMRVRDELRRQRL